MAPPGDGEIEIHYTGLSFLEPEKVRFKYRLVGFDRDWVDAGTRRVAYYTNIPPNLYRFEVIAANNDGVWNETGARPRLRAAPPLLPGALVPRARPHRPGRPRLAAYQARIRQLAARERLLARLVKDRTRELEQANQMLARFSYLDAVTGIANRRNFDDGLELEWRRLLREGGPLSLVMIDIDHFKAFNDTYGHQKGDECLKAVAEALRRALHRPGDICARYGGEEFGVILPGTDAAGAFAVAEGLRQAIEDLAVPHAGSSVAPVVTISVGVATVQPQEGGAGHGAHRGRGHGALPVEAERAQPGDPLAGTSGGGGDARPPDPGLGARSREPGFGSAYTRPTMAAGLYLGQGVRPEGEEGGRSPRARPRRPR